MNTKRDNNDISYYDAKKSCLILLFQQYTLQNLQQS